MTVCNAVLYLAASARREMSVREMLGLIGCGIVAGLLWNLMYWLGGRR